VSAKLNLREKQISEQPLFQFLHSTSCYWFIVRSEIPYFVVSDQSRITMSLHAITSTCNSNFIIVLMHLISMLIMVLFVECFMVINDSHYFMIPPYLYRLVFPLPSFPHVLYLLLYHALLADIAVWSAAIIWGGPMVWSLVWVSTLVVLYDSTVQNWMSQFNFTADLAKWLYQISCKLVYIISSVAPSRRSGDPPRERGFMSGFLFLWIRESPPSIMITRNLTGLSEILRQGTGCVNGRF